jgi:hypothetical protein
MEPLSFAFFQKPHDLARFGVSVKLRFFEDWHSVDRNFKASAP